MTPQNSVFLQRSFEYPASPYSPGVKYLEYPFKHLSEEENHVYRAIRNILRQWGFNREKYNMKDWNPLREFVSPGDRVYINIGGVFETSLAHLSLLRVVMDYIYIATSGKAEVFVGFSPMGWSPEKSLDLELPYSDRNFRVFMFNLPGEDPLGYTQIDLGDLSAFSSYSGNRELFSIEGKVDTHGSHSARYFIGSTALSSSLLITLFKPSINQRLGMAGAIASFLGLAENPSKVPIFSKGKPSEGGDECPEDEKDCSSIEGRWWGNDTLWRSVIDIARAVLFYDYDGGIRSESRKVLFFTDMVKYQNESPGLILAAINPVALDCVITRLMGIKWLNLPLILGAISNSSAALFWGKCSEVKLVSEDIFIGGNFEEISPLLRSQEPPGWKGKLLEK